MSYNFPDGMGRPAWNRALLHNDCTLLHCLRYGGYGALERRQICRCSSTDATCFGRSIDAQEYNVGCPDTLCDIGGKGQIGNSFRDCQSGITGICRAQASPVSRNSNNALKSWLMYWEMLGVPCLDTDRVFVDYKNLNTGVLERYNSGCWPTCFNSC